MVPFGQTLSRSLPAASDTSTVPSRSAATPNGLDSVGGSAWLYGSGSVAWYFAMSATTTGDLPGRSRYSVAPPARRGGAALRTAATGQGVRDASWTGVDRWSKAARNLTELPGSPAVGRVHRTVGDAVDDVAAVRRDTAGSVEPRCHRLQTRAVVSSCLGLPGDQHRTCQGDRR